MTETESEPLASAVGRNCRRLRTAAGLTQNDLAKHAKAAGLRWTASKVGDFESGRTAPTFATVIAVSRALSSATKGNVTPSDLVASARFVVVTDELDPDGEVLAEILRGKRAWESLTVDEVGSYADTDSAETVRAALERFSEENKRYPQFGDIAVADLEAVSSRHGLDEQRVAKRLGVSGHVLAAASTKLWGRSFSDERDSRAGADANAQRRGRVSRDLQSELREALTRGDD